jgi:hypothetical protein
MVKKGGKFDIRERERASIEGKERGSDGQGERKSFSKRERKCAPLDAL